MTSLGIFGGTFDPIHVGHLVAAADARELFGLDRVLLVPAAEPWQKVGQVMASAEDRLAMVTAAVAGVDGLEAEGCEVERGGPSYTVETLEVLRDRYAGHGLVLVLGADAASRLATWHRADELRGLAELAVVDRPGDPGAGPPPGWPHRRASTLRIDVSSSEVRARLAAGRGVDWLVPAPVVDYIRQRGLYGSGDVLAP